MKLLTRAAYSGEPNQREQDNRRVAYEAACEGIVLLKNNGVLPLHDRNIALYGAGASRTVKGGTGSGEVNERHSVTALEGLKNRGFQITTQKWIDDYEVQFTQALADYRVEKRRRVNYLKVSSIMNMLFDNFRFPCGPEITEQTVAQSGTDTCVYILSRQAGEGGDRRPAPGDLYATEEEKTAIRFCAEHYRNFVLVINSGSTIDTEFARNDPNVGAILYMCQPGTEGGHALADILSGLVTPSGKLSDTWAKRYEDIPFSGEYSFLNGDADNEYYKEGIYLGYRYFDSFGVAPAYPFGFGLSYTEFSMEPKQLNISGSRVSVTATVTNAGSCYAGKEVAQLYVSVPDETLDQPYQVLAAFAKSRTLTPGQSQQLHLEFDMKDIASYRESDHCRVLPAGEYLLRLGNSSRDTQVIGRVQLRQTCVVSRHQPVCPGKNRFEELKAPKRVAQPLPVGVITLTLRPEDVCEHETADYQSTEETEAVRTLLNGMSVKDMADMVVGVGQFGGKTRFTLPGSVGNTTSRFWDRGIPNMPLCDGPAGLRIQKVSTVTRSGTVKPVEMAMSVYEMIPGFIRKFITGDPEKETPVYQYTTAFPVANALAQSWNTALVEQVGRAVQREMEEYGCTYWLAPAVNIHRNPLCGRNFEYFSEDPCLTGEMAAAMVRGVQHKPGYYVTVKHFACNNQEEKRNFSDSHVSQRALREIYLEGFHRAVRAGAKGIMTSYNLINGVRTANSRDLCTRVLREEWGFQGVVMTDWYATNRGQGRNDLCIAAGNDLIMPGMPRCKWEILRGLRKGTLTKEDLRRCCANIIRAALESNIRQWYLEETTPVQ